MIKQVGGSDPFIRLQRKNQREHELKNVDLHRQEVAQKALKRKLVEDEEYDNTMVIEDTIERSFCLPRPMTLVLTELKERNDDRIVHSDLVSRGRYQLTSKKQKKSNSREIAIYLAKESLCTLFYWQETAHVFIQRREADRERIGTRGGMMCMDMGLGKTISMLTYILYDNQRCCRQTGNRYNGCTLVAVPNKLIADGWLTEMRTKWPANSFEYYVLQSSKNRFISRVYIQNCCDIVIVTYPTIKAAYRYMLNKMKKQQEEEMDVEEVEDVYEDDDDDDLEEDEEEDEDRAEESGTSSSAKRVKEQEYKSDLLFSTQWKRIFADESHHFVNKRTFLYKAMMALNAWIRWAMTGTPIQNRLSDICSNFDFIGVPPIVPGTGEQLLAYVDLHF